jgi:hypothetical protein
MAVTLKGSSRVLLTRFGRAHKEESPTGGGGISQKCPRCPRMDSGLQRGRGHPSVGSVPGVPGPATPAWRIEKLEHWGRGGTRSDVGSLSDTLTVAAADPVRAGPGGQVPPLSAPGGVGRPKRGAARKRGCSISVIRPICTKCYSFLNRADRQGSDLRRRGGRTRATHGPRAEDRRGQPRPPEARPNWQELLLPGRFGLIPKLTVRVRFPSPAPTYSGRGRSRAISRLGQPAGSPVVISLARIPPVCPWEHARRAVVVLVVLVGDFHGERVGDRPVRSPGSRGGRSSRPRGLSCPIRRMRSRSAAQPKENCQRSRRASRPGSHETERSLQNACPEQRHATRRGPATTKQEDR